MIIALVLIVMLILTFFIGLEHKFKVVKVVIILAILLLIGTSLYTWIKTDTNDLSSPKGVANSIYAYAGWMGDISMNLFSTITEGISSVGNVIKGNETIKNPLDGRK